MSQQRKTPAKPMDAEEIAESNPSMQRTLPMLPRSVPKNQEESEGEHALRGVAQGYTRTAMRQQRMERAAGAPVATAKSPVHEVQRQDELRRAEEMQVESSVKGAQDQQREAEPEMLFGLAKRAAASGL